MDKFDEMLKGLNNRQLEAVNEIERHVSINAGAGSGKTKVLAIRYLNILRANRDNKKRKINPENILAITYTNKAANEMRSRIRKYMESLVTQEDRFWSDMVLELNNSQISTIHSLCSRILQENCVEAGLDPDFTYAEEYEGDLFEKNFLDNFIHKEIYSGNSDLLELLNIYGYEDFSREIKVLAGNVSDIMSETDLTAPYRKNLEAEADEKEAFLASVMKIAAVYEENSKSVLLKRLHDNLPQINEELKKDLPDYDLIYDGLRRITPKMVGVGEEITKAKRMLEKLRGFEAEHRGEQAVLAWQRILKKYYDEVTEFKRSVNFLSFDDLENMTLELLKSYPEVRKRYFDKFPYIMVDEFQDANEKQKQIIYYLCGNDSDRLVAPEEGKIKNLFVVGDPKQSIYRFRGAQVHVFNQVRKDIAAAGGNNIYMNVNYRSDKKIIEGVNHFFGDSRIMGVNVDEQDITHVSYDPMLPKSNCSEGAPIRFMEFSFKGNKYNLQPKAEANEIVKAISDVMVQEFFEEKQGQSKKLSYGDIAILVRSTRMCSQITRELKNADIEYVLIDGKNLYEEQEILDLLHLLKIAFNKYATVELAGVLRSPLFGLKDGTIAMLCMNSNNFSLWDMLSDVNEKLFGEEEGYKVSRARRILQELRKNASVMTLDTLLRSLWKLLDIDFIYGNQEYGAMKLANAKKFLEDVDYFCRNEKGGLAEYLKYVELRRATGDNAAQANMPSMDAVKIMTIHKSKGLDFPVVFVPMLDFLPKGKEMKTIYIPGQGLGVCVTLSDGRMVATQHFRYLSTVNEGLEDEERLRILYVAMTRASKMLFLSGGALYRDLEDADMINLLPQNNYMQLRQVLKSSSSKAFLLEEKGEGGKKFVVNKRVKQVKVPLDSLEPLAEYNGNGITVFSPSMLKKYLQCPRLFYYKYIAGIPEIIDRNSVGDAMTGSLIGSILHKALELYNGPVYDKQEAESVLKRAINLYEASDAVDISLLGDILQKYLSSTIYSDSNTEAVKIVKELNFCIKASANDEDSFNFTGQIDKLIFKNNSTMEIVDYKTASLADGTVPQLAYRVQLSLYIMAAETLYPGHKVTAAKLHFLRNQKEYVQDIAAVDELKAKIQESVTYIQGHNASDEYPLNEQDSCKYCPYGYICNMGLPEK